MKKAIAIMLILALTALCLACGQPGGPTNVSAAKTNTQQDPSTAIYVSPNGNDRSATGEIGAPYKSINAALSNASPGDTIVLRGGTYREGQNVRIRMANITIKSANGEWAIIDLTSYDPGCDEDSGVYFDVDSSGGRLQGVEVMGGFYAVCMETKWGWGGDDDYVAASNIVIEDCVLHDSRYDVVKVKPNCDNITIQNNEIYNSGTAFGGDTSGESNAEGIDNVNGDNMIVRGNYIHDICGNGVYAKGGATNALIENNKIERAYGAGIMVGFDTSPEYFDIKANPRYYENIGCVVKNNLVIDAGWEGIGFYGSKDAEVYNNTLVNVVAGGQYHSAIYFGLTYQDWESYAGRPPSTNAKIHHNIICQPASFSRPMIEIRYANELGGMSAFEGSPDMHDNCYYIAGKSVSFVDNRPKSVLENGNLSQWQSHIGGDSGSFEADPELGDDYLPKNPLCAKMGISYALDPESRLSVDMESASPWARDAIQSALKKGFVPSDIRGDFKAVITRAQFCRMAVMWLEYATDKKIETLLAQKSLKINPSAFSDTQDSYILAAYALGITSGTRAPGTSSPGLFTPNGNFTREQAATMVLNTVRAYGANTTGFPEAKYADIDKASNWAIEGINFCYAKKIMVGTSENPPMFSPQQTYTREQAIITFDNIKQGELA